MVEFTTIQTIIIVLALIIGGMYFWRRFPKVKTLGPLTMIHTKKGVKMIDKIAKVAPWFWRLVGNIGIVTGFLFMILLVLTLVTNLYVFIRAPAAAQATAQLIIPGITTPLIAGLLAIIVLAVTHEISHGIQARNDGIKVKSVGPLFLGFIPIGAFVEPDEKQLKNTSTISQLRVYAAGSFTNIALAIIFLAIFAFLFIPSALQAVQGGVLLTNVIENSPAESFGLEKGMIINLVNDIPINNQIDFAQAIHSLNLQPGDEISLYTQAGKSFDITAAERDGRGWIGIEACGEIPSKIIFAIGFANPISLKNLPINPECYSVVSIFPEPVIWFTYTLLIWNIILSFGVGLFNLLPLKPLDGGLMFEAVINRFSSGGKNAKRIIKLVTFTMLALLLVNILGPAIF